MTTTRRATSTVVGVFHERRDAEMAVAELERIGFSPDQVGFITRDGADGRSEAGGTADSHSAGVTTDTGSGSGAVSGLAAGGVIGGIIGATAALLVPGVGPVLAAGFLGPILGGAAAGAAIGAVGGGIVGALVTTGVPEEEARYYDAEFRAGRTIVTVRADERYDQALRILRDHGAYDIDTRGGHTNTTAGSATTTTTADTAVHHAPPRTVDADHASDLAPFQEGTIRIPVRAEEASVRKEAVVTGEVVVHKERVVENQQISDTVRRTEVEVDENYFNEHPRFQQHFQQANQAGRTWDEAEPNYRYGYAAGRDARYAGRDFEEVEPDLRRSYAADDDRKWEQLKAEVREGFRRSRIPRSE